MMQYDAIILGSGQAGNPLASELAKAGWKVALVEQVHSGGTLAESLTEQPFYQFG